MAHCQHSPDADPMAHVNNDTPTSQDVATIIAGGKQTTDTEWATLRQPAPDDEAHTDTCRITT